MRRSLGDQSRIAEYSSAADPQLGERQAEGWRRAAPEGRHAIRGHLSQGVAMKRFAGFVCAALAVLGLAESAQAGWGTLHYGGHQPWWNIFAHRNRCMSAEEERLQRFWHDYYHALKCYYGALDNIDWVAYYKNHGYQINTNCGYGGCGPYGGSQRIQFAPV